MSKVFVTSAMAEFLEENKEDINKRSYFMVWEKFTESSNYLIHLEESAFMGQRESDWSLDMALAIRNGWTANESELNDNDEEVIKEKIVVPKEAFREMAEIKKLATSPWEDYGNLNEDSILEYLVYDYVANRKPCVFIKNNYELTIRGLKNGFELEKSFALRKDSVDEHGDAVVEFLVDISLSEEGNVTSYKKDEAHKFKSKEEAGKYLPILGERWTIVDL